MTIKLGSSTEINTVSIIEPYSAADLGATDFDEQYPFDTWVRPDEWLDMPVFNPTDSKAAILVAVESGSAPEKVSIYTRGDSANNYKTYSTIDWGDGSSEIYSGNGSPSFWLTHEFNFADLPANSEFMFNGRVARQAMIMIDGSVSGIDYVNLTRLNGYNDSDHVTTSRYNKYSKALEVSINAPELKLCYNSSSNRNLEKISIYCDNYYDGAQSPFKDSIGLKVAVMNSGATSSNTNLDNFFFGCLDLQQAPFLDTSSATTMRGLFQNCNKIRSVPTYDSSNVTDFYTCFWECRSLERFPEWDYSKATSLSHTFGNMHNLKAVPHGVSWPTGLYDLYNGFYRNRDMIYLPSDMNLSGVTSLQNTFQDCLKLEKIPVLYAPNATTMRNSFYGCDSLKKVEIKDLTSVTDMNSSFRNCDELREVTGENLPTGVTDFFTTFYESKKLLRVSEFNTANAVAVNHMFGYCNELEEAQTIDLSSFDGSILNIFTDCYKIKSAKFININSKITNAQGAFRNCYSLKAIPSGMFVDYNSCPSITQDMFKNCNFSNISGINLSGKTGSDRSPFYTAKANIKTFGDIILGTGVYLDHFLLGQEHITHIPDWDASGVVNLMYGFQGCKSLVWSDIKNLAVSTSYYACSLGSGAIENIFNNLVSGVVGQTIDIRNNYGAYQLSSSTLSIATNKGWTVTT